MVYAVEQFQNSGSLKLYYTRNGGAIVQQLQGQKYVENLDERK